MLLEAVQVNSRDSLYSSLRLPADLKEVFWLKRRRTNGNGSKLNDSVWVLWILVQFFTASPRRSFAFCSFYNLKIAFFFLLKSRKGKNCVAIASAFRNCSINFSLTQHFFLRELCVHRNELAIKQKKFNLNRWKWSFQNGKMFERDEIVDCVTKSI